MNLEDYTKIKPLKGHYLLLDNTTDSLVLLKRYNNNQKELLIKLQSIQNKCNIPRIIQITQNEKEIVTIESFINGITLEEYLNNIKTDNITISTKTFIIFLETFYQILKNFKETNIVHRDIKTSNIIVTPNEEFYLIDFNISRIYNNQKDNDTTLFGTKGYAAPEQYGFSQTNFKSDIYSLGKVLEQIYLSMDKNNNIEKLIENMTNIDFNKRASLNDIQIYLINSNKINYNNVVDFIPYYFPFQNNIYNIFYNFLILSFLIYINIYLLNLFNFHINHKILIILLNIAIIFLFKFIYDEFKHTNTFKKIINYKPTFKIVFLFLYTFVLISFTYLLLILTFKFLTIIFL